MADKSVKVILSALTGGFVSEMKRATSAAQGFARDLGKASRAQPWKDTANHVGMVGLALTGVALGAVKMAADFESSLSAVAATGGEARESMDELRAAAIRAGADTKYSAGEAAGGIEELLKAGVSVKDVLAGGLDGALALAASGNLGVAESAEVAASAMTQFGLSGDQVGHIADLLAAGAGKAMGEVSDMAAALKQSGLVAAGAGLSIEETTGVLAAFASNALVGSDAGTSFKTMLQRLQNPSKEAASVLEQYNIQVYDANGQMVSMANLAGQLQDKMGTLTDEQRNAALATVFGSDAIRAANVLYKEGERGIAGWTKAVDEQGYAAQVAATRMDNLNGDLEQLGGSFETLAVAAGTGSQGPLRGMVQTLTDLVNLAGRHQVFAQSVVAVAGGLGLAALAIAGVMKTVTAVNEFSTALNALAPAGSKARGALGGVSKAALGAVAAFVALQVAQAAWSASAKEQVKTAEDLSVAMGRAGYSISDSFKFTGALGHEVKGLDDAFKQLKTSQEGFGKAAAAASDMVYGGASVYNMARAQMSEYDKALTEMAKTNRSAAASEQFDAIRKSALAQGITLEQLAALFPEYSKALQASEAAQGRAVTSAEALTKAGDKQAESARIAAKANAENAKSILDAADAALSASGSQIALEKAIDDATAAAKENGRNLDINTEKGRANRSALDDIAGAALRLVDAEKAAGTSAEEVAAKTQRARDAFISTAVQMGMTGAEAEKLADKYGLIPKTVATDVRANLDQQSVAAAQKAIDSLTRPRSITITANNQIRAGGQVIGMAEADGGIVRYASGGIRENHVAQIAKAGTWRVWAEDETGGESYIPLHPSKRTRSLDIWRQTGRLLGARTFADGGLTLPYVSPGASLNPDALAAAVARALDGACFDLGSVDPITHHVTGRLVTAMGRQ